MTGRSRGPVLLLALALAACGAEPEAAGPPSTAGTFGSDGADLYYRAIGTGRPIVVIHGGPGLDHRYFLPWIEPLGRSYRVVLYDQRGVGSSTGALDSSSISMARYLDDLDAVRRRAARVERMTLLAHSWAAIPALLYALERPDRVDGIVLANPVEPGDRFAAQTAEAQQARRTAADQAAIDSLVATPGFAEGDTAVVNRLFEYAFRGTFADRGFADSALRLRLAPRTARQGRVVSELLMRPLVGLDLWDRLGGLNVPILIVHGAQDPIPTEMVTALADSLPDARLHVLEGAGHFPFIERPDAFFELVDAFIREIDGGS